MLDWALETFSGYVAADALYEGPYCVLSVVDNRQYKRILYEVLDHEPNHDDIAAFLGRLKTALAERTLTLKGITTDGSALYLEPIRTVFGKVPHQRCPFHVIKELTQGVLKAVANADSSNMSVLLGNGNGTVQPAANFAVGFDARAPAVGDFNGDGTPDLAVANGRSHNVQVLLNNGTGSSLSFQPAVIYPGGLSPVSMVVDDFNCDGTSDLATAEADSHKVSVLSGNGDGTFQGAVPFGTGFIPFSVAVGDFGRPCLERDCERPGEKEAT